MCACVWLAWFCVDCLLGFVFVFFFVVVGLGVGYYIGFVLLFVGILWMFVGAFGCFDFFVVVVFNWLGFICLFLFVCGFYFALILTFSPSVVTVVLN